MSEQSESGVQLCTFEIGELRMGVNVLDVQEILYQADITTVPRADPAVEGLINLRGQIATTIDLRSRLGVPIDEPESGPIHVVIKDGGESVSLLVDRVGDVLGVDEKNLEAPPDTMSGISRDLMLGVYKLEDGLLLILDVHRAVQLGSHHAKSAA